jgi:hypothetical protein
MYELPHVLPAMSKSRVRFIEAFMQSAMQEKHTFLLSEIFFDGHICMTVTYDLSARNMSM